MMEEIRVGNSSYIREMNLAGIFHLIHQLGPISRKELAENTGYSAATISNHVRRLQELGFVIETRKGASTGGRRPVYLTINPDKGHIISIEIGVNQVKLVLFNLKLSLEEKRYFPVVDHNNPKETLEEVFRGIEEITGKRSLGKDGILGIGLAVPGLIDREESLLSFAPNLGWSNVPIVRLFEERFGIPVVLENEANAAAIGEKEFVYPGAENMVYISINEGTGCGIIFNGRLYRGASGNAGEFGHIIIDSQGPYCHCGNRGCWETLASENFLLNTYRRETGREVEKEEIYRLGEGDEEVIEIFKQAGRNIGIGLVNIINSLSPDLIVIGGGIIRIRDIIFPEITRVIEKEALTISARKTQINFSKLGELAVVSGLARLVFDNSINLEKGKVVSCT